MNDFISRKDLKSGTHRKWLCSLLDNKALDHMSEDLRLNDGLWGFAVDIMRGAASHGGRVVPAARSHGWVTIHTHQCSRRNRNCSVWACRVTACITHSKWPETSVVIVHTATLCKAWTNVWNCTCGVLLFRIRSRKDCGLDPNHCNRLVFKLGPKITPHLLFSTLIEQFIVLYRVGSKSNFSDD